jgi:hypothetical protein
LAKTLAGQGISREYEVEVVLPKLDLFGEYQEQQQALFSALLIYGINL